MNLLKTTVSLMLMLVSGLLALLVVIIGGAYFAVYLIDVIREVRV